MLGRHGLKLKAQQRQVELFELGSGAGAAGKQGPALPRRGLWPCGAVSFVVPIESRWVVGDGCVRPQPCLRLVDLRARYACINPLIR